MTVEINLLEQRERKNLRPSIILGGFILIILMMGAYFYHQHHQLKAKTQHVEEQIAEVMAEQDKLAEAETGNVEASREDLTTRLAHLEDAVIPALPLLESFVASLPERGFFDAYRFEEPGTVEVVVRFDMMQEAAAYASRLKDKPFVQSVEVSRVTTDDVPSAEVPSSDYLPRYIAEYQVRFDPDDVKEVGAKNDA
ncbi:hypothetical protein [Thalassobacillus sp. CUG 92003]|uniref:hypothetical protein n=1 Tax=Thalassobacillus sp. CUG 92003 TaxID=2736641 RepID=UPI0015E74720|nr:hypothetical protein [Thalassobacillus sp. CUG 92003]